jgi:hypothetical protein
MWTFESEESFLSAKNTLKLHLDWVLESHLCLAKPA